MPKTILITGAGSGFGESAAIGMAKNGHTVIATVQVSPQVTPLREKAKAIGISNLRVERLDLTDPYDIAQAQTFDVDVLWNNAGMGEAGPVFEIPVELVRHNSMGGLFTPANWGVYVSTKHALESDRRGAQARTRTLRDQGADDQSRRRLHRIQREHGGCAIFRWLDDSKHVTKRAALRREFNSFLKAPDGHLDAREMIDGVIEIVPADTGKFRNVVPKATEDMLKAHQLAAWENQI